MQLTPETTSDPPNATAKAEVPPPFGSNEIRLGWRQWLVVVAIVGLISAITPAIWKTVERFPIGPDYRIPYVLSKDYWLYERLLQKNANSEHIDILGDSVVWGEYVRPDGTLSHFLNESSRQPDRFRNCGVNGLFPLAMEGLVEHYGNSLTSRKIIVQCNVLWLTSPQSDLSGEKPQRINHARLLPQFFPRIPSYDASASDRISAAIENRFPFFQWTNHLQNAYYDQMGIPQWTLKESDDNPPKLPNAWRNPLAPFRNGIPVEPATDPERGPGSRRHKPWNADGAEPTHFEWVSLDHSLQWRAFQRVVLRLREQGNDVMVIVGPFNEHLIAKDQLETFHAMRAGILSWLQQNQVPAIAPPMLPSEFYADASHPLTRGYARLAQDLWASDIVRDWVNRPLARQN